MTAALTALRYQDWVTRLNLRGIENQMIIIEIVWLGRVNQICNCLKNI